MCPFQGTFLLLLLVKGKSLCKRRKKRLIFLDYTKIYSNKLLFNSSNIYPMYLSYMVYILLNYSIYVGFPGGPDGKEFTCNVGDLGSIPGLGRSPGGGYSNPLHYSYLKNPMDRGAWEAVGHGGHKESDMSERLSTAHVALVFGYMNHRPLNSKILWNWTDTLYYGNVNFLCICYKFV